VALVIHYVAGDDQADRWNVQRRRIGTIGVALLDDVQFLAFESERVVLIGLRPLRANIDETVLPVIITEQGEDRIQCEEQQHIFGFPHGFACR
jgi:hypothetical protein